MTAKLRITIAPDGTTTLDVTGMQGAGCLASTAGIEAGLGPVVVRTEKPELHAGAAPTESLPGLAEA